MPECAKRYLSLQYALSDSGPIYAGPEHPAGVRKFVFSHNLVDGPWKISGILAADEVEFADFCVQYFMSETEWVLGFREYWARYLFVHLRRLHDRLHGRKIERSDFTIVGSGCISCLRILNVEISESTCGGRQITDLPKSGRQVEECGVKEPQKGETITVIVLNQKGLLPSSSPSGIKGGAFGCRKWSSVGTALCLFLLHGLFARKRGL